MPTFIFAAFALLVLASPLAPALDNPPPAPVPVLVELFTSEGCSSCPPADTLLQQLDRLQPISGAQIVVLSEHVDYWNSDAFKDPFSSTFFTERQRDYARRLQAGDVYTPQMLVDGAAQFNGSDAWKAQKAIQDAMTRPRTSVRIAKFSLENPKTLLLHLEADPLPASSKIRKADLYVAIALDHAESSVGGGENKGKQLKEVAVAESIKKVGAVDKDKGFAQDVRVKLNSAVDPANLRLFAFAQEPDAGIVVGTSLPAAQTH